jgi:hypothetical protein
MLETIFQLGGVQDYLVFQIPLELYTYAHDKWIIELKTDGLAIGKVISYHVLATSIFSSWLRSSSERSKATCNMQQTNKEVNQTSV